MNRKNITVDKVFFSKMTKTRYYDFCVRFCTRRTKKSCINKKKKNKRYCMHTILRTWTTKIVRLQATRQKKQQKKYIYKKTGNRS